MASRPKLCERCIACVELVDDKETGNQRFLLPEDDFIHHSNLEAFHEAVRKACIICNYLYTCWSPLPKTRSFSTDLRWNSSVSGRISLRFRLNLGDAVTVELRIMDDSQAMSRYNQPLIPDTTADDEVLQTAHSWVQYCKENHPACEAHRSAQTYYPSRLLDLKPESVSTENTWKLVEKPSETTIQGGYATLSHRWKLEPVKLTKDTREAMLGGLPDSCLHGTYRDAMRVARSVGLRYLWIDSLCIPQDPGNLDIQIEAYRMAEVYGNSSCNISALTAQADSIFASRNPLVHSPSATIIPARLYSFKRSYTLLLSALWQRSVMTSELAYRGWILQEQLLPRRTLYFGKQQLIWSCRFGGFCETYPLNDETLSSFENGLHQGETTSLRNVLGYALRQVPTSSNTDETAIEEEGFKQKPVLDWIDLLMLYGRRNLTFGSDKLVAIAGLSRLVSTMKNDQLISGLFSNEMPSNLLWAMDHLGSRQDDSVPIAKSPVDRAPSWSWAAYDGPICAYSGFGAWGSEGQRVVSRVVDVETAVTNIEDFEVIRGKTLRLYAASLPLIPLLSEMEEDEMENGQKSPEYWFIPFSGSTRSSSTSSDDSEEEPGVTLTLGGVYEYYETGDGYEEEGEVFFDLAEYRSLQEPLLAAFISFQIQTSVTSDDKRMSRFDGLILRRTDTQVTDPGETIEMYERVGSFAVTLLHDPDERPDTPMTTQWNFDQYEMNDNSEATYPEFNFETAADFMRVIEIS